MHVVFFSNTTVKHQSHTSSKLYSLITTNIPANSAVLLNADQRFCFSWPDIVSMVYSKKHFIVETSSLKSVLEMVR